MQELLNIEEESYKLSIFIKFQLELFIDILVL